MRTRARVPHPAMQKSLDAPGGAGLAITILPRQPLVMFDIGVPLFTHTHTHFGDLDGWFGGSQVRLQFYPKDKELSIPKPPLQTIKKGVCDSVCVCVVDSLAYVSFKENQKDNRVFGGSSCFDTSKPKQT